MDETTVRELLREVADVPGPSREMPVGIRRRARRRIAVTLGVTVVTAVALVAGSVAGVRSLMRLSESVPADRGAQREPIVAIPLDHTASQVAVGEGSVWAAGDGVARIDQATGEVISWFNFEGGDAQIAFSEGAVWVGWGDWHAAGTVEGDVVRIDPATNDYVDGIRAGGPGGYPLSLASAGGFVWAARFAGPGECCDGQIYRIDPSVNEVDVIPFPGFAIEIVGVLDGRVWLTAEGELFAIDAASGEVAENRPIDVPGSISEATTGFGSLWGIANALEDPTLARVDPSTGSALASIDTPFPTEHPRRAETELRVAVGEGSVWAAKTVWDPASTLDSPAGPPNTRFFRIDPATNQVVGTVDLDVYVAGMAAGEGALWVTTRETIYRIDVSAFPTAPGAAS